MENLIDVVSESEDAVLTESEVASIAFNDEEIDLFLTCSEVQTESEQIENQTESYGTDRLDDDSLTPHRSNRVSTRTPFSNRRRTHHLHASNVNFVEEEQNFVYEGSIKEDSMITNERNATREEEGDSDRDETKYIGDQDGEESDEEGFDGNEDESVEGHGLWANREGFNEDGFSKDEGKFVEEGFGKYEEESCASEEEEEEEEDDDSLEAWHPITKIAVSAESFLSDHGIQSPKPKSKSAQKQQPTPDQLLRFNSKGVTKPISPNLNTEKRFKLDQLCSPPIMTTEQLLLKKLEEEREGERQHMERRKKLYERLKANGFNLRTKAKEVAVKKVTIPKTPKSVLDKKYGKKIPSVLKKSPIKFTSQDLRDKLKQAAGPTVPEPFHFETEKRIQLHHQSSAPSMSVTGSSVGSNHNLRNSMSQSMTAAEIAAKFFQEARQYENTSANNHGTKKLTEPHSPILMTAKRSSLQQRAVPLSHEEIEAQQFEEIQKHPFKARPLDKRIFESHGEFGVPKVPVKPPTVPVDIELRTEKRAASPRIHRDQNDQNSEFKFKARPLPSYIKDGPTPLPVPATKKSFQPTIPVSPKFHQLSTSREDEDVGIPQDEYKELRRASSAPARRQRPHHSLMEMQKKLDEEMSKKPYRRRLTQTKEFHFETDQRGQFYQQQFQQQLAREQEEEMKKREVKALELPSFTKHSISSLSKKAVPVKPLTEPEPFHLRSVDLHEAAVEHFHQIIMKEIQEKQEEEKRNQQFKAKPLPKTTYEPEYYEVTTTDKENQENIMKPLNIVLESDKRAEKRREYDEKCKKQMEESEAMQKQALLEKENRKQLELKAIRRKSVEEGGLMFKAKPILTEDPFPVKMHATHKKLTQPKSPNLRLKERREMKQQLTTTANTTTNSEIAAQSAVQV